MGLFDSITAGIKKVGVQAVLDAAVSTINTKIKGIATVQSLTLDGKHIKIKLVLDELENLPLEAVCRSIKINDAGTQISLDDFTANKKFLETALNRFAARTFDIPDKYGLQAGLRQAKSLFT